MTPIHCYMLEPSALERSFQFECNLTQYTTRVWLLSPPTSHVHTPLLLLPIPLYSVHISPLPRHKLVWYCIVKFTAEPQYNYSATTNQNVQCSNSIMCTLLYRCLCFCRRNAVRINTEAVILQRM